MGHKIENLGPDIEISVAIVIIGAKNFKNGAKRQIFPRGTEIRSRLNATASFNRLKVLSRLSP